MDFRKLVFDLKTFSQYSFQQLALGNEQIQAAVERILINQNLQPGQTPLGLPPGPVHLSVPEHVRFRLEDVIDPEFQDPQTFPLRVGVNGFTYHFLECTARVVPDGEPLATTRLKSWLNLMKSIFILLKMKESKEYDKKVRRKVDPMWISFLDELEERCRKEYQKYTLEEPIATRLPVPTRAETILLFQDDFRLTFHDDSNDGEDGIPDISVQLKNEILHLIMDSPNGNQTHELGLVRTSSSTLIEMQSLKMGRGASGAKEKTESTIDLTTADLFPSWAELENPGPKWKIQFKESKDRANKPLVFAQLGDLYSFQQTLTGFKVAFDNQCRDVKFRIFCSSDGRFSSKELPRMTGKVQLWYARKIDANTTASHTLSPSPSSPYLASPGASSNPLPSSPRLPQGRFVSPSPAPGHHYRASTISSASRLSVPSSIATGTASTGATSVSTAASVRTYLSAQTTAVSRDGNVEVIKHEKPLEPFLVFLIRKDADGRPTQSLLGIKLDAKTGLARACKCRDQNECVHAQIERPASFRGGTLDAYRGPLDGSPWNLAAFGAYQRDKRAEPAGKLRWVQITFDRPDDRKKFVDILVRVKRIWKEKCVSYEKERESVRRETIIQDPIME